MQRTAGAKNCHLIHAQGGGNMHQTGVIADGAQGPGDCVECLRERRLAGQVDALAGLRGVDRGGDLFAQCVFLGGAEQQYRMVQTARQLGKMVGRPTFGRAEFGARRKHVVGSRWQVQLLQRLLDLDLVSLQQWPVAIKVSLTAERRIERHHRRSTVSGRIFQALRQQSEARLTQVANAVWDARQKRQQRTFEGIGTDIGGVKAALDLARHSAPGLPLQAAMGKGQLDHLADLRHQAVDRCHPGQGSHCQALAARGQTTQQRLGHHRVAYPLGRDDQRIGI